MAEAVSSTVTLLFTDIEGSTRLMERATDAYRNALREHHSLLRELIESHGGRVFETIGDGVYAAFPTAANAVAGAVVTQLRFADRSWEGVGRLKVRMAIHSGELEQWGHRYFGRPLYRCARLLSAGHGGQVLLSSATAELVRSSLPADVELKGLGAHRLRDLADPEPIYQVLHPALPAEFPPLRTLNAALHSLPIQLTSFVGRQRELAEVRQLLGSSRLVTLKGMGGTGKTRLAAQVAAEAADDYADGVWFVDLAPLADGRLVAKTIARTLGVEEEVDTPLLRTLQNRLVTKELLLVLDNCEHLIDACAETAEALLQTCPHLRILATSREALGIGETIYEVASLSIPSVDGRREVTPEAIAELMTSEAVALFVERARAVQAQFVLTAGNAFAVAAICRRLDGIPLALELAAVQLNALSAEQLVERLDDRFALLTRGSRTALPRHKTLRALLDWSYQLLSVPERNLFARLSVFAAGWTLEAAERVCPGGTVPRSSVVQLMADLVGKSLVKVEGRSSGPPRYRMLETLRQYAWERLEESQEADQLRRQHGDLYLELAERAERELTGADQLTWLERIDADHDNIRGALRFLLHVRDAEQAWRLAAAMWRFWYVRGHFREGSQQLADVLQIAPMGALSRSAEEARANALHAAGNLALQQSDHVSARKHYEDSLEIRRRLNDTSGIARVLNQLGNLAVREQDYERAFGLYEQSLALWRQVGDVSRTASVLTNLAEVAWKVRDAAVAGGFIEEALRLRREIGDTRGIALGVGILGSIARRKGNYLEALSSYAEALSLAVRLGDRRTVGSALLNAASVLVRLRRPADAIKLAGAADALFDEIGYRPSQDEAAVWEGFFSEAAQSLSSDEYSAAWTEGRGMTWEQAAQYALRIGLHDDFVGSRP